MRVVVHDYVGHPFQAQLARGLAARGHAVLHVHCSSFVTGKGRVERDTVEGQAHRISRLPFDPPLAGDERGALEVQDVVSAARQRTRELRRERVACVVVDDEAHVSSRRARQRHT